MRSSASPAPLACKSGGSPVVASGKSPAAAAIMSSIRPPPAPVLGTPVHGDAEAPARLKSVLVRPATPSSPGMLVWQPMDQHRPSTAGSLGSMAPHPAPPTTPAGKSLYSGSGSRWEPGQPSRVKEMQSDLLSPEWQRAKTGRRQRTETTPLRDASIPMQKPKRASGALPTSPSLST